MMLFRSADKKLAEIGFIRVEDEDSPAFELYRRINKKHECVQYLEINYSNDGCHSVLSYSRELHDRKYPGKTSVGLTAYEMRLCVRKMQELGWNTGKPKRRKKQCAN